MKFIEIRIGETKKALVNVEKISSVYIQGDATRIHFTDPDDYLDSPESYDEIKQKIMNCQ